MKAAFLAVFATTLFTSASGPRDIPGASPSDVPTVTVHLTNQLKYDPGEITVKAGTTVVWENASVLVHTVTDDPSIATVEGSHALPASAEPFDSGLMDPGATFRHTFTVEGTYRYFCIPHEGARMWGTVIVE